MYLLKLVEEKDIVEQIKFTFHHVSIKTGACPQRCKRGVKFTFHHVSIKTVFPLQIPLL